MDRPSRRAVPSMSQSNLQGSSEVKNSKGESSEKLTVSVIIPTKNRAADLARTIETLLQQTVQPLELIIVDQSPAPTFTRKIAISVVCIHDPTLSGLTAARNASMKVARGDIWLFL